MLIVDAQIHLWNAGNPTNPNHRQVPAYLKDEALREMDAGGIDAAVLTPHTPWDPNANELAVEAACQHPDRFVILGSFPLDKPESRALVDTLEAAPGDGRPALRLSRAGAEQVADGRDEGAENGRLMRIAFHPYAMGRAHRVKYLAEVLDDG
jgi:predicted TIM-barrel fold metal-dependent hydrolase